VRPQLSTEKPTDDADGKKREYAAEPDGNHDNPPSPARETVHGVTPGRTNQRHVAHLMVNDL